MKVDFKIVDSFASGRVREDSVTVEGDEAVELRYVLEKLDLRRSNQTATINGVPADEDTPVPQGAVIGLTPAAVKGA